MPYRQTPGQINYTSGNTAYRQAVPPLPVAVEPNSVQMGMGIGDLTAQAIKDHAAAAAWPLYKATLFVAVVAVGVAGWLWVTFDVNPRVLAGLVLVAVLGMWGAALWREYAEAQALSTRVKARHDSVNDRLRPPLMVMPGGGAGVAPSPAAVRYGGVPEGQAIRIILRYALVRAACEETGEAQPRGGALVIPHTPVGFPQYDARLHSFAMRTLRDMGFMSGGVDTETGRRRAWRCLVRGERDAGGVLGLLEPYLEPGGKLDSLIAQGVVRRYMAESGREAM